MQDPKKTQELWGEIGGKAVEAMTVWAEANQRVLRDLVELSAVTAKESFQLYASATEKAFRTINDSFTAAVTKTKGV